MKECFLFCILTCMLIGFHSPSWFGMPINGVPNMHNMPINSTRMNHLSQLPGVPYTVNPTLLESQYAAIHDSRYMRGHRHAPYPLSANPGLRAECKVIGEFLDFDFILIALLVINISRNCSPYPNIVLTGI